MSSLTSCVITSGRNFERLVFNNKHPNTNPVTGQTLTPTPFHSTTQGFVGAAGRPLPNLGLDRELVRRHLNFQFAVSMDLFGSEQSTNAGNYFTSGLKGRWGETRRKDDHVLPVQTRYHLPLEIMYTAVPILMVLVLATISTTLRCSASEADRRCVSACRSRLSATCASPRLTIAIKCSGSNGLRRQPAVRKLSAVETLGRGLDAEHVGEHHRCTTAAVLPGQSHSRSARS